MLDWTSLRPDVGRSDGLGDGSEDSRPLETTYGPLLSLPNGLSDGCKDGNPDGVCDGTPDSTSNGVSLDSLQVKHVKTWKFRF